MEEKIIKYSWVASKEEIDEIDFLISEIYHEQSALSIYKENEKWVLSAYFNKKIDTDQLFSNSTKLGKLSQPKIEIVNDDNWVKLSLQGLGKIETTDFIISGSHDEIGKTDKNHIIIDANQAFGTGHHPTTIGCLEILSSVKSKLNENSYIWDCGCGSAILSIAAAKLCNSAHIFASDIDEKSCEIANENIVINQCELIKIFHAGGCENKEIKQNKYDLIMANILSSPLIDLCKDFYDLLKDDGNLIISGLMIEEKEKILHNFKNAGFKYIETKSQHQFWPSLLFTK